MKDKYVIYCLDKREGSFEDGNSLCYDTFGRNIFVGSLLAAKALQEDMVALHGDYVTYTICKLVAV